MAIPDTETTIVFDRTYFPYGRKFAGEGSVSNSHQYTGKEFEGLTEQYYYGARFYSPSLGRFLSTDPAGIDVTNPQSWNRYAYVQNNPFTFVDPDGRLAVDAAEIISDIGKTIFVGGADLLVAYGVLNTTDPTYIYSTEFLGQTASDANTIFAFASIKGLSKKFGKFAIKKSLVKAAKNTTTVIKNGKRINVPENEIQSIIKSARRPKGKGTTSRGSSKLQQKGNDKRSPEFTIKHPTQKDAEAEIRSILEGNPVEVFDTLGRRILGNTETGKAIRLLPDGQFDTFLSRERFLNSIK